MVLSTNSRLGYVGYFATRPVAVLSINVTRFNVIFTLAYRSFFCFNVDCIVMRVAATTLCQHSVDDDDDDTELRMHRNGTNKKTPIPEQRI